MPINSELELGPKIAWNQDFLPQNLLGFWNRPIIAKVGLKKYFTVTGIWAKKINWELGLGTPIRTLVYS